MSGDDANVQTAHNEETVCHINPDGHDRQSLRAALESYGAPFSHLFTELPYIQ